MCRLIGLCALNMGAFLTLFYTPVVSETRSRPQARMLFRASRYQPQQVAVPGNSSRTVECTRASICRRFIFDAYAKYPGINQSRREDRLGGVRTRQGQPR